MSEPQTPEVDAVVIGAGFGGIYMLHKLRDGLGLKVRAYDKAGGVGGTWYWNKYPGAMSDTEAHIYQYSFDKEMLQAWDWKNRYWNQPDILGRDSFRGTMVHTGNWPADLTLEGKRVGVIGTGSTGTQFICAASQLA